MIFFLLDMLPIQKKMLEKQGFRIVGNHAGTKPCYWTKNALTNGIMCYKGKFYGIRSHRCVQMTPNFICNAQCIFCWRDLNHHTSDSMQGSIDPPELIIEETIKAQNHLLNGFPGHPNVNLKRHEESKDPWHFAISLDGEPTLYKHLPEMIKILNEKQITSMVVSNGYQPNVIKTIQPTQLYISVDAPNKELFQKIDRPLLPNAWERLNETFTILSTHPSRIVLRMTIIKDLNNVHPEQWADIIKKAQPMFVEVKSYTHVGASQERLEPSNMLTHEEVKTFALDIARYAQYDVADDSPPSKVVLLMKNKNDPNRFLKMPRLKTPIPS